MVSQFLVFCGVVFLAVHTSCTILAQSMSNKLTDVFDYPPALNLLALKTNAPVRTPVTAILPPLNETEYYINFVTVVYGKYDTSTDWTCADCLLTGPNVTLYKVASDATANTLALINLNQVTQEIIVTFRGSVNLVNYVLNGMLMPIGVKFAGDNGKAKVHAGFWIAADSLYSQIEQTLLELLQTYSGYRLVFVGHSLGGPLATLTALRIRSSPAFADQVFAVFAYGSPRIGNVDFADFVNSQSNLTIVRPVNKGDLVAHIPARGVQPIYVHFSNQIWITPNGSVVTCATDVYEDPTCSNSLGPVYNVNDHTAGYFGTNFVPSVTDNWCPFLMQILINIPAIINIQPCNLL